MRRKNNMGHAFVLLVSLIALTGSVLRAQSVGEKVELGVPAQMPPPGLKPPMIAPVQPQPGKLPASNVPSPTKPGQKFEVPEEKMEMGGPVGPPPGFKPPMLDSQLQQPGIPMPNAPGSNKAGQKFELPEEKMEMGGPLGPPPGFNPDPSLPFPMDNGQPMDPAQRMERQKGARPSLRDAGMLPPATRANSKPAKAQEEDIAKVVPQTCKPATGKFIWNFEEEKLMNILRQVSDLLCMSIVVNDSIADSIKMTIIGKQPLTPQVAKDVLLASMASKGLTLAKHTDNKGNDYWSVEKKSDAKNFSSPTYENGKEARNNEEIGTLFYKVQHTTQEELKATAKMLISRDGMAEAIGDQFVMIIDTNSNIRRLGNIFEQIDIEDAMNKIHAIKLEHADPKTVERQLKDLFDIQSGGGRSGRRRKPGPGEGKSILNIDKIIADERTNSLIVVADKESVDKLKEVVALIDAADTDKSNKGKIHVKKLKFADAKKIAETLSSVVQQGRGNRYGRRRDEDTNELFEGEVKITAHESSNTLVTVASANDYRALSATIDALDERKEQVYVEAAILDIEVKNSDSLGINVFSGLGMAIPGMGQAIGVAANPGGKSIVSGLTKSLATNNSIADAALGGNGIGALAVLGNFLSGGVAGIVGPRIQGTSIPSFGAVLQAVAENSNVDILSTPYLLTSDNQEATMAVGEKVPVLKGASPLGAGVGGGLGITAMQNIAYEDVKLTFKITPHVGADDNVRLDISQEVNELGTKHNIMGQDQYAIRTKSASTSLVLKDQQTGVIGGLISNRTRTTDNKVPFLGDIPILGWLFKTRESDSQKRSLLLIITPYVIKTEDDYRKILDRKLKEREEFARLYYGGKIKNYNPHIDYDRKSGPLSTMLVQMDVEMSRPENGGAVEGDDVIIKPKDVPVEPKPESTEEKKDKESTNDEINLKPIAKNDGGSDAIVDHPPVFEEFKESVQLEDSAPEKGSEDLESTGG